MLFKIYFGLVMKNLNIPMFWLSSDSGFHDLSAVGLLALCIQIRFSDHVKNNFKMDVCNIACRVLERGFDLLN